MDFFSQLREDIEFINDHKGNINTYFLGSYSIGQMLMNLYEESTPFFNSFVKIGSCMACHGVCQITL